MKEKKVPMRKCIGCNEMKPKREIVRIVKSNEGVISIDFTGKKNGRGAYICRNEECLSKAVKRKGLEHAFSQRIESEIYEKLKEGMVFDD